MGRYIEGQDRTQSVLFPERLDDWIDEDNPVRVVDVFVDELDLRQLGFERAEPAATGRPAYHPATLLKIYVYGYLNRVQSSRRLEREAQRNLELIWLTGRLAPDFKTIADFRRDNGEAIRKVCQRVRAAVPRAGAVQRGASSPSTAASSRRSTTATRTSPTASCRPAWSSSRRASSATWSSSIVPTATQSLCRPKPGRAPQGEDRHGQASRCRHSRRSAHR